MSFVGKIDHLANVVFRWRITSHAVVLQWGYTHSVDLACRLGYRVCNNEVVDLKPLWSKKKKKKRERRRRIQICVKFCVQICFSSLFLFWKKKTKITGCIIIYLHSASRLTGKFTLDVCISKRVCMRAGAPVCACVSCTHVRALIHVFDNCGCMCAPVSVYLAHRRHGCEHPGMYDFMCVSVF